MSPCRRGALFSGIGDLEEALDPGRQVRVIHGRLGQYPQDRVQCRPPVPLRDELRLLDGALLRLHVHRRRDEAVEQHRDADLQQGPVDHKDVGHEEHGALVVDTSRGVEGDGVDPGSARGDAEQRDARLVELAEVLRGLVAEEGNAHDRVCERQSMDKWIGSLSIKAGANFAGKSVEKAGGLFGNRVGRLTHGDEYQQDAECVEHGLDRCCQRSHDMIEGLESSKDPDDSKHANHANDADWYWYRAQRH